jgi:hypothetical protein
VNISPRHAVTARLLGQRVGALIARGDTAGARRKACEYARMVSGLSPLEAADSEYLFDSARETARVAR